MPADRKHTPDGPLLNGSSLSHLTGAVPSAKLVEEVRFPASSMAEVLSVINRLGHTGQLQVNFHKGRAGDMKFVSTKETKADV